ncbi:MAG: PilZ domain-containing protein [Spirochaetaceae bacterium]
MSREVGRIEKEFILKNAIEKHLPVEVHFRTKRYGYVPSAMTEEELRLHPVGDTGIDARPGDEIAAFTRFRGQVITFKTTVLEQRGDALVLRQPTVLYRDLSRGFERILHPEGISVSFIVQGTRVELNYPASESYETVEEPSFDPGFDVTRISELLKTFRERAEQHAGDNKIVMFRERKPETFQERVIARSGKILILPFPRDDFVNLPRDARGRLLSQDEAIETEKRSGGEVFATLDAVTRIIKGLNDREIWEELYCPVLYREYVVGYLYLAKSGRDVTHFDSRAVEFVLQYSRVLAYALEVNGYFTKQPVKEEYGEAVLIDISGSGILFSYPADGPSLSLYEDVELRIHLENEEVPATARVMRKYRDSGRVYFGAQFLDIDTEGMDKLFDRLYGTRYRGEIDSIGLVDHEDPEAERFE